MRTHGGLVSVTVAAVAAFALAALAPSIHAAAANTQVQTCPVAAGGDPDPVTLSGPASLSPPNHLLSSYGITSSETAGEAGDNLPHGVTIAYSITTIDTPGGSSVNSTDSVPPTGSSSGDFTTTASFQLRAERPGTARTYQIDWNASFDGLNGQSVHTCSSTDGTHRPFLVAVDSLTPAVPDAALPILLPVSGLLVGGMAWFTRSRRRANRRA